MSGKDPEVTAFIADLAKIMPLDGVKVRWPDGRKFIHAQGRWTKMPDTGNMEAQKEVS